MPYLQVITMLKKITLLVVVSIISGCATSYKAPQFEDTALIKMEGLGTSYTLTGGASGKVLSIGELDNEGCMTNIGQVDATAVDENGYVIVPANKEIGMILFKYKGNANCKISIVITLKNNDKYELNFVEKSRTKVVVKEGGGFDIKYIKGPMLCELDVVSSHEEKVAFVTLEQNLFSVCKSVGVK
ncbi:hypothetical protein [uncultured Shewanella sp.]|uniref:hypothetical protein n=1 Tax=uncultured Shewanella sp. TaxID=173975 RepID=UPI00260AC2A9|nr:hypothetical protein [uncultured Shewanella sp.]